jgi:hypothetical protein
MKKLTAALRRLFWRHQWRYTGDQRTCTTCDRCEVNDGDAWGPHWLTLRPGDKVKHGSQA